MCSFFFTAIPCNAQGGFLLLGSKPQPQVHDINDWTPYMDHIQFEVAQFLYKRNQMSSADTDTQLYLWAAMLQKHSDRPPFKNQAHLLHTIDKTPLGNVKWNQFSVQYTGEVPNVPNPPIWMKQKFEVWYRDPHNVVHQLLSNPDFAKEVDLCPYCEFSTEGDVRQCGDFMSGNWAWQQAASIIIHILELELIQDDLIGHYIQRSRNTWQHVCANNSGQ